MGYSFTTVQGDGSTQAFSFAFGYLSREHVSLKVDGVVAPFTWIGDYAIRADSAPPASSLVEIRRKTPIDSTVVDWTDGSVLTEANLDLNSIFSLYVTQEARDAGDSALNRDGVGRWDAKGTLISNVADPINAQDAASNRWVTLLIDATRRYAEVLVAGVKGGHGSFIQKGLGGILQTFQAKMEQAVSLKDFGAVSDNSTDDQLALAKAAATSRPICYTEGITYVSTGVEPESRYGSGRLRIGNGPALPPTPFSRSKDAARVLNGFEPERLSGTTLRFFRGSCTDSTGRVLIENKTNLTVDINTIGLNGLDVGSPIAGENYFPYVLMNSVTEQMGIVMSKQISTSFVTRPAGFDLIRKLPWGVTYFGPNVLPGLQGIRAFSLQGWPKPHTHYTESSTTDDWAVVKNGVAGTFAAFDLSAFVPDNARVVGLCVVTRHDGVGAAGVASIRVSGGQATGQQVGAVSGAGARSITFLESRITSTRTLLYNVTGGAIVDIYVTGYTNIEPS